MGCSASKGLKSVADDNPELMRKRGLGPRASMLAGTKTETFTDPATREAQRLVASNGSVEVPMPYAGYTLRYAYVSQRGYYPDQPDKANQDGVCATEAVAGNKETHLFGVFDGHGELGTECAQFCQDKVPANLRSDPAALAGRPAQALAAAVLATNGQLRDSPVEDSLSGTTACCVLVEGRTLLVANVGDSRAVLAERSAPGAPAPSGSGFTAHDLSQDQTPFRPDECLRVLKAGARVLTLDQLEGLKDPSVPCWTNEAECDGDPPRLWSPAGMYPGTAFTRSIGDSAAESIGVIADPELTTTQLGPQDAFVVLATDGVWEFISSQDAVDLVAKYDNPYDAAKALVAHGYKLWLQHETRTDDITAVILFLDWAKEQPKGRPSAQQAGTGAAEGGAPQQAQQPPVVVRQMSRALSRSASARRSTSSKRTSSDTGGFSSVALLS